MKRFTLTLTALIAILPLGTVAAAPLTSPDTGSSQAKFTILPGPLTPGKPYKQSFDYTLAPGQTYSAILSVVNASHTSPVTVKLRVAEATTLPVGGGITFSASGQPRRLGLWIRPGVPTVTVAPYSISNVPVIVSVPSNAAPGQYGGAFDALDTQAQTMQQGKSRFHLYINIRRLISLQVTGTPKVGLTVDSARVAKVGGHAVLDLRVRNSGNVVDHPFATTLTLTGAHKTYTLQPTMGMLIGGDSTALRIPLDGVVPAGRYRVRAEIGYAAQALAGGSMRSYTTAWSDRLTVPSGAY